LLGALVSLALVALELIIEWPRWDGPETLATLGLLGAPVGFVLGRQAFPEARSGGWGHGFGIGVLIGSVAPPLGLIVIALVALILPGTETTDPLSGLALLVLAIPFSFIALVVTLPVGFVWSLLVGLVPPDLPARLRVPSPFDRVGVRHATLLVLVVACLLVARRGMAA
jgi:hypothetical protein